MAIVQIPTLRARLKGRELSTMALNKLGLEAPKVVRSAFKKSASRINTKMRQPGKRPVYPLKWASRKQQKAFFASRGFDGGIPHVRKGFYIGQWQEKTIRGGYQVQNLWNKAGYVAGDIRGNRQSSILKGRWNVFRIVVNAALKVLPKEVVSEMKVVIRKIGFKVR